MLVVFVDVVFLDVVIELELIELDDELVVELLEFIG